MAAQGKKTTEELAAENLGIPVEKLRELKAQTRSAKSRGKRPAGTAGAEAKLAGWGAVDGQQQLFACDETGNLA